MSGYYWGYPVQLPVHITGYMPPKLKMVALQFAAVLQI
jgi:hypothetical protein